MRDLKCDVLADMEAGKVVSPRRIKKIIRINEIMIGTYGRWAHGENSSDAALQVEKLRAEIAVWKALLAASDKIIDALEAAIDTAAVEDVQALRDMQTEWKSHAAGISSHWTRHIKPGAVDLPRAAGLEE